MTTLDIVAVDHIGIRVSDAQRSEAFYAMLGFEVIQRFPEHAVVILRNRAGIVLNFIVNAVGSPDGKNVLFDEPVKHPGYTHVALRVASAEETLATLAQLGIAVSEGPVRLGDGDSIFVRDPDNNVVELHAIA